MKKITLIAVFLTGMLMTAQEKPYDNFNIDEKKVVWEKVFDSELKEDSLRTIYLKKILWNENSSNYNVIDGNIVLMVVKKEIGRAYPIDYTARIYFKDNKYKVKISDISFNREGNSIAGYSFGNELIEYIVLKSKNSKWKTTNYAKKISSILNSHFLESYELTSEVAENDDW